MRGMSGVRDIEDMGGEVDDGTWLSKTANECLMFRKYAKYLSFILLTLIS
jgi:hypothetical protein